MDCIICNIDPGRELTVIDICENFMVTMTEHSKEIIYSFYDTNEDPDGAIPEHADIVRYYVRIRNKRNPRKHWILIWLITGGGINKWIHIISGNINGVNYIFRWTSKKTLVIIDIGQLNKIKIILDKTPWQQPISEEEKPVKEKILFTLFSCKIKLMSEVEFSMNTNINNKVINLFYLFIIYMYIDLLNKRVYEQKEQIFLKNNVLGVRKTENFFEIFLSKNQT